jgi:hypothetical protein
LLAAWAQLVLHPLQQDSKNVALAAAGKAPTERGQSMELMASTTAAVSWRTPFPLAWRRKLASFVILFCVHNFLAAVWRQPAIFSLKIAALLARAKPAALQRGTHLNCLFQIPTPRSFSPPYRAALRAHGYAPV